MKKYEPNLKSATQAEQISIMQSLWNKYQQDTLDWFEWTEYSKETTSKHRELLHKAFAPFATNQTIINYQEAYDNLAMWMERIKSFAYRNLPSGERNFYTRIFTIVNDEYPQVANEWLTPQELYEQYGFSKSWQSKARMASSGSTLPYHKVGGKFIRYKRSEIEAWMDEHKVR